MASWLAALSRPGYAVSQRIHKRIEYGFDWIKAVAVQWRARHRIKERVDWQVVMTAARSGLAGSGSDYGVDGATGLAR